MSISFKEFPGRPEASTALASDLAGLLRQAVNHKGSASLVLSGGSSPLAMLNELSDKDLPWSQVTVLASDERAVAEDHPDRNEAMIQRDFLRGPASEASLQRLIPMGDIPPHFDAVVLGMGGDGHTASLFPGSPQLSEALSDEGPCLDVEVPQLGAKRVTLTLPRLLAADRVILLFFGEDKRAVYEQALAGKSIEEFPVRSVLLQDRVPVDVYWAP